MKPKVDFYKVTFLLIFAFIGYSMYQTSLNGRYSISVGKDGGASIIDTRTGAEYRNELNFIKKAVPSSDYDSMHIGKPILK